MVPKVRPWQPAAGGVTVRVRAQPGAARNEIAGIDARSRGEVSLKVRVRAPAEKGKATEAVIETLARALGLARSRLRLKSGATARTKLIVIEGDAHGLLASLERLVDDNRNE